MLGTLMTILSPETPTETFVPPVIDLRFAIFPDKPLKTVAPVPTLAKFVTMPELAKLNKTVVFPDPVYPI